jgi:hypothetical protein
MYSTSLLQQIRQPFCREQKGMFQTIFSFPEGSNAIETIQVCNFVDDGQWRLCEVVEDQKCG